MHNPTITGLIVALGYTTRPQGSWRQQRVPAPLDLSDYNPYRKKDYLFTTRERKFYDTLCVAAEGKWKIFAQVRLEELVQVDDYARNRDKYRGHIKSRDVDFVLCSMDTVSPVLVIELDGESHEDSTQKEIDANKDAILRAAGLPVLREPVSDLYSLAALSSRIEGAIAGRNMSPQLTANEAVHTIRGAYPLSTTRSISNSAPTTRTTGTQPTHRDTKTFSKQQRSRATSRKTLVQRRAGLFLIKLGVFLLLLALVIFAAGLLVTGVRSALLTTFGLSVATPPATVATQGKLSGAVPTVTARTKTSSDVGRALPDITATVNTVNLNLRAGPGKQYQQYEAYP